MSRACNTKSAEVLNIGRGGHNHGSHRSRDTDRFVEASLTQHTLKTSHVAVSTCTTALARGSQAATEGCDVCFSKGRILWPASSQTTRSPRKRDASNVLTANSAPWPLLRPPWARDKVATATHCFHHRPCKCKAADAMNCCAMACFSPAVPFSLDEHASRW